MTGTTTIDLLPRGGQFLADLAAAVRGSTAQAFAASAPGPALLELPPGALGDDVPGFAFDASPEVQQAGWAERLARLRERLRPQDVKVFFVTSQPRDGPVVIGSSAEADVLLPRDEGVAARHAELFLRGALWRVRDLESGTWVEGKRLPAGIPLPIVGGHRLRVGSAELLFLTPDQLHGLATPAPPAAERRGPAGLVPPPRGLELRALSAVAGATPRDVFERASPGPFLLQVPQLGGEAAESGAHTKALTLEELLGLTRDRRARAALVHTLAPRVSGGAVVVGRDAATCQVVLPEASVSRRHATFTRLRGQLVVMDLESQNGTWVDDARLPVGVTTPVRSGQVIGFGPYRAVLLEADAMHDLAVRVAAQPTERMRRP